MLNFAYLALGAAATLPLLAMTLDNPTPTPPAPAGVKNIVLVHGAWADGSSWSKVIPLLTAKGYHVMAVQNSLTSLADDVAATKRVLALQDGPVLLVGHSWGGTVITEAGNDPKVVGLVYVAAGAPDSGQSFVEITQTFPVVPGTQAVKPDPATGFLNMPLDVMTRDFAPDLPAAESKLLYATQGPLSGPSAAQKVTHAAWADKPSWYALSTNDRMINPDLQRALAKKMKATVLELPSSHVSMLSHPKEVADFIISAAQKVAVK